MSQSPPKHGDVWWTELMTRTPEGASAFYCDLFGWTARVVSMQAVGEPSTAGELAYTLFMVDGNPQCGAFTMTNGEFEGVPPHWFSYFAVDDVDAACEKVVALGGRVLKSPFEIKGTGRIAIVQDPEGAVFGIGQAAAMNE